MRTIFTTAFAVFYSVLGVGATHVPAALSSTCTQNACLTLVTNGQQQGGHNGCLAFFETTLIPPTVTSTSTTTLLSRTTIQKRRTSVFTSTQYAATVTATSFITVFTSTSTIIASTSPTATYTSAFNKRLAKRAAKTTTTSMTTVPPASASACPNTRVYSSACSCISVQHSTTTLAAPTITETTDVFSTTTVSKTSFVFSTSTMQNPGTLTISTTSSVSTYTVTTSSQSPVATDIVDEEFLLQIQSSNPAIDGDWLEIVINPSHGLVANITNQESSGTLFSVNPDPDYGEYYGGEWHTAQFTTAYFAEQPYSDKGQNKPGSLVQFSPGSGAGGIYLTCAADENTGAFTCRNFLGGYTTFAVCSATLWFGSSVPSNCDVVSLVAIYNGQYGAPSSSGYFQGSNY